MGESYVLLGRIIGSLPAGLGGISTSMIWVQWIQYQWANRVMGMGVFRCFETGEFTGNFANSSRFWGEYLVYLGVFFKGEGPKVSLSFSHENKEPKCSVS